MVVLAKASGNLPETKTSSANVSFSEWALLRGANFARSQQYRTLEWYFHFEKFLSHFRLFSLRYKNSAKS
jgi:hypothetical protein